MELGQPEQLPCNSTITFPSLKSLNLISPPSLATAGLTLVSSILIIVFFTLDSSSEFSDFFSEMKETAYILNLSRGPVINEKDLEHALENKLITGAGLDVTTVEPLPVTSKLLDFENVIITPHALCWTDECFNDIASEAINSIINYIDKKPILNLL